MVKNGEKWDGGLSHWICFWFSYVLFVITTAVFMLCFVLINSGGVLKTFSVFGSCFRMLGVILVSDFWSCKWNILSQFTKVWKKERKKIASFFPPFFPFWMRVDWAFTILILFRYLNSFVVYKSSIHRDDFIFVSFSQLSKVFTVPPVSVYLPCSFPVLPFRLGFTFISCLFFIHFKRTVLVCISFRVFLHPFQCLFDVFWF